MNKKLLKSYIAPSIALITMSNVSLLVGSNISSEDEDSETIFTDGGDATGSIEGGWSPW